MLFCSNVFSFPIEPSIDESSEVDEGSETEEVESSDIEVPTAEDLCDTVEKDALDLGKLKTLLTSILIFL